MSQRHAAMVCILLGTLPLLPRGPLGHQHQFLLVRKSFVPRLVPRLLCPKARTRICPITPEVGNVDAEVMIASADILQAARNIATVDLATSAALVAL